MVNIERETNKLDKHRKSDLGFVNTKVCITDSLLMSGSQMRKYLIATYLDSWRAAMSKKVGLRREVTKETEERYRTRNQGYRS